MKKNNKINFFKRLKIAVLNLDEYGIFIEERLSISIKYMLLILILISLGTSIALTYVFSKEAQKALTYFENDYPEFSFQDDLLNVERYVEAYDKDEDFYMITDTNENIDETQIKEYTNLSKNAKSSMIILKDKIIYRIMNSTTEYKYEDLKPMLNIDSITKSEILQRYYDKGGIKNIATIYMIIMVIGLFIENIIEFIANCLLVTVVAILVARICGISIRASTAGTLSIYSLTFPVILSFIYSIVYNLTGFEIKYFQAMYMMIAYVYIIAAILIIKTDLIKQAQELMRIKSIEEQIKDELEKEKLEKEDKPKEEDENKKDNDENSGSNNDNKEDEPKLRNKTKEPDGSEI